MNKDPRIKLALDNSEEYIARLATYSDEKLADKLDAIHMQLEIAMDKKIEDSIELLIIWRIQVISASIFKAENNIPDAISEIEEAIKDIETVVVKEEQRQEVFETRIKRIRPKQITTQGEGKNQLRLF